MSRVVENTSPNGWDLVRLEELSDISIGKTPPRSKKELFFGNNIWLSIRDLNGDVVSVSNEKITDEAVKSSNMKIISEGTLLMSFKLTLGKTSFAGCDLYTNEAIASLPIKDETVLNKYFLKYALATIDLEKEVDNAVKGKTLNKQKLKNLEIPLPSLEEQKRIVAKIDTLFAKIDKAISLTEKSLNQAKNLLPSVLKEVFEKGKADGWEEKKWDEVLEIKNGKSQKEFLVDDGGYPIYGSGGLMNGRVSKFLCPKNTTIVGRKGTIDKPKYIEEDFWNVDTAFGLCSKTGLNPRFLYYFCLTFNFRSLNKSTTLPSLTKKDLLQIRMPITTSENQMKVVKIADDILLKSQKTQSKLEEQLAYLKQLKSSLLSKAFKGEL